MSKNEKLYRENLMVWTADRDGWLKDKNKALELGDEQKVKICDFFIDQCDGVIEQLNTMLSEEKESA